MNIFDSIFKPQVLPRDKENQNNIFDNAFSNGQSTPFDATKRGIAVNTVKALGSAQTYKDAATLSGKAFNYLFPAVKPLLKGDIEGYKKTFKDSPLGRIGSGDKQAVIDTTLNFIGGSKNVGNDIRGLGKTIEAEVVGAKEVPKTLAPIKGSVPNFAIGERGTEVAQKNFPSFDVNDADSGYFSIRKEGTGSIVGTLGTNGEIEKASVEKIGERGRLFRGQDIVKRIDEYLGTGVLKKEPLANDIPKDLEPLAIEARKYKSAEEFVRAITKDRGGVGAGVEYSPAKRLVETDLNNRSLTDYGFKPDDKITIYRGVDRANQKTIQEGDYIALSEDLAKTYTGGKVLSQEVPASSVRLASSDGFSSKDFKDMDNLHIEAVYNPRPLLKQSELTDFYNKVRNNEQNKTYKPLTSGPKAPNAEVETFIRRVAKEQGFNGKLDIIFDKNLKAERGLVGNSKTNVYDRLTGETKAVIELYTKGGKSPVRVGGHELNHVLSSVLPDDVIEANRAYTASKMDNKDFEYYRDKGYKTRTEQIDEFMADEWGKHMADKKGYKSRIQKIIDFINTTLEKVKGFIDGIGKRLKETPNKEGGFIKNPIDELIAEGQVRVVSRNGKDVYQIKKGGEWVNVRDESSAIRQLNKKDSFGINGGDIGFTSRSERGRQKGIDSYMAANRRLDDYIGPAPTLPVKNLSPELERRKLAIEIKKEALANSPYNLKDNASMVTREGMVKELGDVKNKALVQKIEDRMASAGIDDPAKYTEGLEKYLRDKNELALDEASLKQEIKASSELPKTARTAPLAKEEAGSLEELGQQSLNKVDEPLREKALSLPETLIDKNTPVKEKVSILDYMRTPDRVLRKIGLGKISDALRHGYDSYLKELPAQLDVITQWSKEVPKESNVKIFKYLDGQEIALNDKELKVAGEIKEYLSEWASRLNLPEDSRISNYITHIFDIGVKEKEFDEEIAELIRDKVPGSVYDPFLEERLGAKGYVEDTWRALDAYVKRAVRKANMDPALEMMKAASGRLEESQLNYVTRLGARINMRPTEWDTLLDNGIKQLIGYKFGQRPVTVISRTLRKMVYRGALGLNLNSAVKNLTQGVNTFAKLGAGRTVIGYLNLMKPGAGKELEEVGVLQAGFIQDRTLNATKQFLQKADKGLFAMFQVAEYINRGAAYFGAKSKAIAKGMNEQEAVDYAKKVVRDTQFVFGSIDTPVAMQGDIAKTLFQFGSFAQKQTEFLSEMAKNKEYAGIIRYMLGAFLMVYTIGKVFDVKGKDFNPLNYFSRFGKPPALALPIELIKAITNIPDQYGNTPTLKKKVDNIIYSGTTLIPAGVQLKKLLGGSIVGKKKDKAQSTSEANPFNSF